MSPVSEETDMRTKNQSLDRHRNHNAMCRLEIEGLFGHFNYRIPSSGGVDDVTRLMVLYGDNGCGKTTILKLLYHLFAVSGRGHKTFVAGVPFRRFAVELTDETVIDAYREGKDRIGGYCVAVRGPSCGSQLFRFVTDERGRVTTTINDAEQFEGLRVALEAIDMRVDLLPDDRRTPGLLDESDYSVERRDSEVRRLRIVRARETDTGLAETSLLQKALRQMTDSLRTRTIAASSMGYASANAIYDNVLREIARYEGQKAEFEPAQVEEMVRVLDGLSARAKEYASLGVTGELNTASLIEALKHASLENRGLIFAIISPYVDSVKARFDALEDVGNAIESFTRSLNHMYSQKTVAFSLTDGLSIHLMDGANLSPELLSSGETQLLLLLANAVNSRGRSSVLAIDEPELSLNVKWQRQLVRTLLECVGTSPVQLVLATHSIELIAQHRANVVKLASDGQASMSAGEIESTNVE